MWKSKFYGAFVLNHRVVLHAIDATPARWCGDAGSSPLDRARTAASALRAAEAYERALDGDTSEGDRAASRQLLTTPESSPSRRPRRSGSEADLEAIASQLNSPTDVSDDAALGFDDSGRRLDRLLDDAERRRIQKAYGLGESPRAPHWLPPDRDTSPLRAVVSAPTTMDQPVPPLVAVQ